MRSEFGLFSKEGIWEACTPPTKHQSALGASRQQFLDRLAALLTKWQMQLVETPPMPASQPDIQASVEPA